VNTNDSATDAGVMLQETFGYWNTRKHLLYYKALFQYMCVAAYDAQSIIDVGSAGTEYLEWVPWVSDRVMLDAHISKSPSGIRFIEADFINFDLKDRFDVALCCQVLEHVEDPGSFCDKLKSICKRLIVTVPYNWPIGAPGHIQDPVDEHKLRQWMGLEPNYYQIVHEPFREGRLIAIYDLEKGPGQAYEKTFVFRAIAEKAKHMIL